MQLAAGSRRLAAFTAGCPLPSAGYARVCILHFEFCIAGGRQLREVTATAGDRYTASDRRCKAASE
jgi:hypothetical protein